METPAPKHAIVLPPAGRDAPRIPFGSLVENGTVKAGMRLVDRMRRVAAEVTADGNLLCGEHRGSIHKVGAAVQNVPSCNGWTFWHFERNGALLPLDVLRKENPPAG